MTLWMRFSQLWWYRMSVPIMIPWNWIEKREEGASVRPWNDKEFDPDFHQVKITLGSKSSSLAWTCLLVLGQIDWHTFYFMGGRPTREAHLPIKMHTRNNTSISSAGCDGWWKQRVNTAGGSWWPLKRSSERGVSRPEPDAIRWKQWTPKSYESPQSYLSLVSLGSAGECRSHYYWAHPSMKY